MTVVVSARSVRDEVLHPVLDGMSANGRQKMLLFNPSAETDSLLEVLALGGRDGVSALERQALARLAWELALALGRENRVEGELQHAVAGFADTLARDLHAREVAAPTDVEGRLGVRELVGLLSGPLDVLVRARRDGDVPDVQVAAAGARIARVADRCPRARLLTASMQDRLGGRRLRLLREVLDELDQDGGS